MLEYGEELTRKTKIQQAPTLQWGDRLTLESWSHRPEFPPALKRWAQVILACAGGKTNAAVARELGIAQLTVGKWRRQFIAAQRMNGS
jgi:transposase-like protein